MRVFRFAYIWVLLIAFVSSKAHFSYTVGESKKNSLADTKECNISKKISHDIPDGDSPVKRKRKLRGVEVSVPHISDISFAQHYAFRESKPLSLENTYSFSEYYVNGERGPPLR
jgi:hypothetical protein